MRRRRGAPLAALTTLLVLAGGCGGAGQSADGNGDADAARTTPAPVVAASERSMREIIADQASPSPVAPEDQPRAPGGDGPVSHSSARVEDAEPEDKPRPTRVRIPALGVDARITSFGVAASGEMEVPNDPDTVAWYEYGPSPGQDGSAVLAAHVDYNGVRGIFFDLAQLDAGDQITVELAGAGSRSFTVQQRASVDKEVLPIDQLFRRDGEPVLTLITCGGEFDAAARSYRSNIVVRAVPAS